MSDYKRVRDALAKALPAGDTGSPTTFEYALDELTPVVLELLADEGDYWARRLRLPPVGADWRADATLTSREVYLQGWEAASDVMAARAGALRLTATEEGDTDTPV